MPKLPSAFRRKDHGSMRDFSAIPAGEYTAKIVESDYVETKSKDGHILKLTFEIQDKEFKGHKFFVNLNLDNPSEKAMEIANNELGTICDAVGKAMVKKSEELHGVPMTVKLGVKDEQNVVKMYSLLEGAKGRKVKMDEEEEEEEEQEEEQEEETGDEISADDVKKLARELKEKTNLKKLKSVLEEYDISKITEIDSLEEGDLESLLEDLEDEIDDAG